MKSRPLRFQRLAFLKRSCHCVLQLEMADSAGWEVGWLNGLWKSAIKSLLLGRGPRLYSTYPNILPLTLFKIFFHLNFGNPPWSQRFQKGGRRTRLPPKREAVYRVFSVSVCAPSREPSSDHQDDIHETCLGLGGFHAKLSFATITSSGATPKVFRTTNLMSLSLSCVQILMPRSHSTKVSVVGPAAPNSKVLQGIWVDSDLQLYDDSKTVEFSHPSWLENPELTSQWKIPIFNSEYIFNRSIAFIARLVYLRVTKKESRDFPMTY